MPKGIEEHTVVIRPEDNGSFVAYLPAIDGCHAWGQTANEARQEFDNVFEMIADEYGQLGIGEEEETRRLR